MDLTSLRRFKAGYGFTDPSADIPLGRAISAWSRRITTYLGRWYIHPTTGVFTSGLKKGDHLEFFDLGPNVITIRPRAYPLATITGVAYDASGQYTGGETALASTEWNVLPDRQGIQLLSPIDPSWMVERALSSVPRGLRIQHEDSGLAEHQTLSVYAITMSGAAMTVGNYVKGDLSGFIGYLIASSTTELSFELLSGIPQVGETLMEYAAFDFALSDGGLSSPTGKTAVLGAAASQCLAELAPDLVEACEMQVKFAHKNRDDWNALIISRDSENRSARDDLQKNYSFLPEVRDMLQPYVNRHSDPGVEL